MTTATEEPSTVRFIAGRALLDNSSFIVLAHLLAGIHDHEVVSVEVVERELPHHPVPDLAEALMLHLQAGKTARALALSDQVRTMHHISTITLQATVGRITGQYTLHRDGTATFRNSSIEHEVHAALNSLTTVRRTRTRPTK